MDDNKNKDVDYLVHESIIARLEMLNKRLFVLCMVIFLAFVGSNLAWIHYENQFEDTVTVTQETPTGNNNYVGHDGNITNGEANNH